jgi:Protein of unknown function (DUF642)/PEP-CTERM motif
MNITLCTVLFACALTINNAHANLILNGSFEQPNIVPDWVVYDTVLQGIPGWTIASGDVDIVQNNILGTAILAHDGEQWIDLNGNSLGSIAQLFDTIVGELYALRFFYSDNPFNNANGPQFGVEKSGNFTVSDDTTSAILTQGAFSHSTTTGSNANWTDSGLIQFTATGAQTRLAFSGDPLMLSTGIFLDSVSVNRVPEPTTIPLLGISLIGFYAARLRFRRI